jgi:glycosyltransferase involved in cell wall biosynthesis
MGNFRDFDMVYCVNLDKFDKALAFLGSPFGEHRFAGMFTSPKFHRSGMALGPPSRSDFIYRALFKRLLSLKSLARITVINEPFAEFCMRQALPCIEKVVLVPDVGELSPVDDEMSIRVLLGIPSNKFIVLLYGSLSRRKGVEQLLRGIEATDRPDVVALIAGEPTPEISKVLHSIRYRHLRDQGRLYFLEGFQDHSTEARLFASANLVWLGYVGGAYGSSGVLYQAGSVGLPVLSMENGVIGWLVKKHSLGIAVNPDDTVAVSDAICHLHLDTELCIKLGNNGLRLARLHTGSYFARAVCGAIESAVLNSSHPTPELSNNSEYEQRR